MRMTIEARSADGSPVRWAWLGKTALYIALAVAIPALAVHVVTVERRLAVLEIGFADYQEFKRSGRMLQPSFGAVTKDEFLSALKDLEQADNKAATREDVIALVNQLRQEIERVQSDTRDLRNGVARLEAILWNMRTEANTGMKTP